VTTQDDGGYYAVIWYDTSVFLDNLGSPGSPDGVYGTFKLLNPFAPPDTFATDNYDVYTTKGTLAMTSNMSEVTFGFGSKYIYTVNTTSDILRTNLTSNSYYDGDISCEYGNNNHHKKAYIFHCLNKTDMFTMLNWEYPNYNPPHINLYTAERLYTGPYQYSAGSRFPNTVPSHGIKRSENEMHYMTHVITTDISTNWGVSVGTQSATTVGVPQFHVYKFFPAKSSTYQYVAPCSNRGICDQSAGVCKCFPGYTLDSCSEQSSLAV